MSKMSAKTLMMSLLAVAWNVYGTGEFEFWDFTGSVGNWSLLQTIVVHEGPVKDMAFTSEFKFVSLADDETGLAMFSFNNVSAKYIKSDDAPNMGSTPKVIAASKGKVAVANDTTLIISGDDCPQSVCATLAMTGIVDMWWDEKGELLMAVNGSMMVSFGEDTNGKVAEQSYVAYDVYLGLSIIGGTSAVYTESPVVAWSLESCQGFGQSACGCASQLIVGTTNFTTRCTLKDLHFFQDGKMLAGQCHDCKSMTFDEKPFDAVYYFEPNASGWAPANKKAYEEVPGIRALAVSPSGSFMAVGTNTGELVVTTMETSQVQNITGTVGVTTLKFSMDEKLLLVGDEMGQISVMENPSHQAPGADKKDEAGANGSQPVQVPTPSPDAPGGADDNANGSQPVPVPTPSPVASGAADGNANGCVQALLASVLAGLAALLPNAA